MGSSIIRHGQHCFLSALFFTAIITVWISYSNNLLTLIDVVNQRPSFLWLRKWEQTLREELQNVNKCDRIALHA